MKVNTKKNFLALTKGAWESTCEERPRLFVFIVLFFFAYSLDLLVPWAIGYTLNAFATLGGTAEAFEKGFMGIAAFTVLRLLYTCFHHYARYVQSRVSYCARMFTMRKIFNCLMRFPLRWHVEHHSGENLSKLHRSVGAVDAMIGTYIWQIIECSVKVVFAGIAIIALDMEISLIVLAISILTIALMIFFNHKLTDRIRRNNIFYNKLNRILVDYLSNIVTVKTLSVESSARKHLADQRIEGLRLSQRIASFMEFKWGSVTFGSALVTSAVLCVYFSKFRGQSQPINIAEVYVLLDYLNRIFQAIGSFTGYYSGLIESSTAYEDAMKIIEQSERTPEKTSCGLFNNNWNAVSFKKVNFSYVAGEKIGLNNVRFEFRRGDKIALVGSSGSGKSTLLKVLGGLIQPDSYSLSTDLQSSLALTDFIDNCLLIPQEPEIFSENVLYNLTMGEEFDTKEISFFISLCKFDTVLNKLPLGLYSSLAEKGLNLSVGEKQRVALARGLLRAGNRELILLDEPTSSLDPKTEKDIYLGLLYHFSSRTIVSSCHRLNLIPLFDRIIFMAQSQVLEVGSFKELIDARGHFYRAWDDYEKNIKTQVDAEHSSVSMPLPE
ncbi:MAG: ABC transporter ATP-binding protein [Deltaproteobacteria bacterium]|nr:ABC transporter ATP-binding protein [Deltaproteobacteria bacterium]